MPRLVNTVKATVTALLVATVLGGCVERSAGVTLAFARDQKGDLNLLLDTCGADLEWVSVAVGGGLGTAETVRLIPDQPTSGQIVIPLTGDWVGYSVEPSDFEGELSTPLVLRSWADGRSVQALAVAPDSGTAMYMRREDRTVTQRSIEQFWADSAIACITPAGAYATFPDVS